MLIHQLWPPDGDDVASLLVKMDVVFFMDWRMQEEARHMDDVERSGSVLALGKASRWPEERSKSSIDVIPCNGQSCTQIRPQQRREPYWTQLETFSGQRVAFKLYQTCRCLPFMCGGDWKSVYGAVISLIGNFKPMFAWDKNIKIRLLAICYSHIYLNRHVILKHSSEWVEDPKENNTLWPGEFHGIF